MLSIIRPITLILLFTFSTGALASNCQQMHENAFDDLSNYGGILLKSVVGNKGFRTYFHTGPNSKCINKTSFVTPGEKVQSSNFVKIGKEIWMFADHERKDGSVENGWMKAKDFKTIGRSEEH